MKNGRKYGLYEIIRILCIDVMLGALASGAMVLVLTEQEMHFSWWLALGLGVWAIYTTDHLLDAYRLKDEAHTPRHLFHHHYFKPIFVVWLLVMISCLTWIPYLLPMQIIYFGFAMGGLVLAHLGLVKLIGDRISWIFHKELGVGMIYSLGVWGGPMIMRYPEIDPYLWVLLGQFFLLAMINLLMFSIYEAETDKKDGHTSFVRAIGIRRSKFLINMMASVVLFAGLWVLNYLPTSVFMLTEFVFMIMLNLLVWITWRPQIFAPKERYRTWGDAVFFLPVLVWLLQTWL